ncbi:malonate--CoA ligase [Pararhodospirillum photometricum]|uniref:Long chain fatty acid CoA ligase n=1 Tax=Pararhodospirillum photometricum DSM 122 TaxID=1150469 RepID=H6SS36_PARPM|nr:malonyl-CoA synthase [Pararhodospirillum photometricum]CCG07715.1 Long chain fatty acid CoA ligase [Pararhodospirillum photometricum DSM 122]
MSEAIASLYALLVERAPSPDKPLLIRPDGRALSYGEAHALAGRLARVLADAGAVVGDRIAVRADKSPEALVLYLACLRGGFVFLPLNTAYTDDELAYLIGDADPRVIVCRPEDLAGLTPLGERAGAVVLTLAADGTGSLMERLAQQGEVLAPAELSPDALAAMLYTSGTTGKPKGAMLTQDNLAANGLALIEAWRFCDDDVLLHALPIFHAHGLFVACHTVMLAGGSVLWLPGFDKDTVLDLLPRATVFMGVPTFYTRLLGDDRLTAERVAGIRLFVSGSAPLLAETHRAFFERTGKAILERYGMTETGMNTSNPYDGERRPGAVGPALPGVSVRIVGEDGAALPEGAVGDVQVKGRNVMKGYWKLPEKTREEFTQEGWFKTGDVGRLDPDGYLVLVGRAKDLIISGGYNVYPKEVEDVIDALPGVIESAVIGVPHPDFGEVGVVLVTSRGGIDEAAILAHCKAHLANYKVPKKAFFTVDLPRNTMGKVQKALLRERYKGLFMASS